MASRKARGRPPADGPTLFLRVAPRTGALDDLSLAIPNDASLLGREACLQAAVASGTSAQLTNALTLHVGH